MIYWCMYFFCKKHVLFLIILFVFTGHAQNSMRDPIFVAFGHVFRQNIQKLDSPEFVLKATAPPLGTFIPVIALIVTW